MKDTGIEILSTASNAAVVRLAGRRYPGIVIQGDSLRILYQLSEELKRYAPSAPQEMAELVEEMNDLLAVYFNHYKSILHQKGIDLP